MRSEAKPSFQKIHYLLRPAKNIQRKMLSEIFQRLAQVRALSDYEYVGFGSIYFGDFILFHRALGFDKMTSIELEEHWDRAEFNKPYRCVTVLSGRANAKLSEIRWKEHPSIVWLDYDCALDREVLDDIGQVASNVQAGSFLAVTLDVTDDALKAEPDEETDAFDLEQFANATLVGKLNLKCGTELPEDTDLTGENLAEIYRGLVTDKIHGSVNSLVDPRSGESSVDFSQVINFRYSDGRDMMTIGGVFCPVAADGTSRFAEYGFDTLEFSCTAAEAFTIDVPKLTYRELSSLNQYFPTEDVTAIPVPITQEEKSLYGKIYRYFPTFAEADISS